MSTFRNFRKEKLKYVKAAKTRWRFMVKVLVTISAISIVTALILTASCNKADEETPPDFNFVFHYGVMGKNVLDTARGTFTKDMVADPNTTIELKLTEDELAQILTKMEDIDFFNYPDVFKVETSPGDLIGIVTPYSSYYFEVTYGSINKELRWDDEILNEDKKADGLRELIHLIRNIVESKEEYKKLPEPRGGYM